LTPFINEQVREETIEERNKERERQKEERRRKEERKKGNLKEMVINGDYYYCESI